MKADRRAASVLDRSAILQFAGGCTATIGLTPQPPVARDLDFESIRQRVDNRYADTVQTARGAIDLAAKLAAGVQHRQNDFERRFVREARMRIDRNTAAVITDRQPIAGRQLNLDARRIAGDSLIHRIIENFGGEMMKAAFVGAADIHSG